MRAAHELSGISCGYLLAKRRVNCIQSLSPPPAILSRLPRRNTAMTRALEGRPVPLLDIAAVSEFCGVSEKTVRRWISAGELQAAKLGNQWRIRRRDLDDFVRDRLVR